MSWTTTVMQWGRFVLSAIVAAFSARPAAALLPTVNVRLLSTNTVALNADSTVSALAAQEVAYSGYAAVTISTWTTVRTANGESAIGSALFTATTATPFVPGTAVGYWLDDGTNFIGGEYFPAGVSAAFAYVGAYLALEVLLPATSPQTP